jgi:isocitrate lyase
LRSQQQFAAFAKEMGVDLHWSAEAARSLEGYYQIASGSDMAISRVKSIAPYVDVLWMDSQVGGLDFVNRLTREVGGLFPEKFFAYHITNPLENKTEQKVLLAKMGCVWQVLSLDAISLQSKSIQALAKEEAVENSLSEGEISSSR